MNQTPFDQPVTPSRPLPPYRVRRSSRARHVNLTISPADGLIVVVPDGFDERRIPALIRRQRNWIDARLMHWGDSPKAGTCRQRPVHVSLPAVNETRTIEYCASRSSAVRISSPADGVLRATGAIDDGAKLRAALRRWLKRRAQPVLGERIRELADKHGFRFSRLTIRHQRSRWGSCSSRGTISLNAKLMFLPCELLDHVLLHELCHTIHPHHGDTFYKLLAELVPDHRRQRTALRQAWIALPGWAHR